MGAVIVVQLQSQSQSQWQLSLSAFAEAQELKLGRRSTVVVPRSGTVVAEAQFSQKSSGEKQGGRRAVAAAQSQSQCCSPRRSPVAVAQPSRSGAQPGSRGGAQPGSRESRQRSLKSSAVEEEERVAMVAEAQSSVSVGSGVVGAQREVASGDAALRVQDR